MIMFQSLLGFLMRCDMIRRHRYFQFDVNKFQSLLGFLMRCDRIPLCRGADAAVVSIPAGFSDALRLRDLLS